MNDVLGARTLRALAVDDHPTTLDYLVGMLADLDPPREVVTERATTETETFRYAQDRDPIDLVLLDLHLAGDREPRDGLVRLQKLRGMRPATPVAVFSAFGDHGLDEDAIRAGAAAFIPKTSTRPRILAVLRDVLHGRPIVPGPGPAGMGAAPGSGAFAGVSFLSVEAREFLERISGKLAPQELRTLGYLLKGMSNREIAECLVDEGRPPLQEQTVRSYVSTIMDAFGDRKRTGIMATCLDLGIKAEHVLGKSRKR